LTRDRGRAKRASRPDAAPKRNGARYAAQGRKFRAEGGTPLRRGAGGREAEL
jgi:hypothetical protein